MGGTCGGVRLIFITIPEFNKLFFNLKLVLTFSEGVDLITEHSDIHTIVTIKGGYNGDSGIL